MATKQPQFEDIIDLLTNSVSILKSEGLDEYVKDTVKLNNQINSKGSIVLSHKDSLYSILRMMLESNSYYSSKSRDGLDQAYTLIENALDQNV